MKKALVAVTALMTTLGAAAQADFIFDDTVLINNSEPGNLLCLGNFCNSLEEPVPGYATLRLNGAANVLQFEDFSSSSNLAERQSSWQIRANDVSLNGRQALFFEDLGNDLDTLVDSIPFMITAGAPTSSLYIEDNGFIGMGTNLPQEELHIMAGIRPIIKLEATSSQPGSFSISASGFSFSIRDDATSLSPFAILSDAANSSLVIAQDGNIGLGTAAPEGKLHAAGDGVQVSYFESTDGGPVQVRMRSESQNRRFLATDNDNSVKSQIHFKDEEILFLGETNADQWLSISKSGIISAGPECNPNPCDLTFDPEHFTVPPIAERAEYMWENMHLPAVGPTQANAPINLSQKMGGVIHELEIAHIYIEQLHDEIAGLRAEKDAQAQQNNALEARMDKIEAMLSVQ